MFAPTPTPEHGTCPLCTPLSDNIIFIQFFIMVFLAFIVRRIFRMEATSQKPASKAEIMIVMLWMLSILALVYHASLKYLTDPSVDVWRKFGGMTWRQRALGMISFGMNLFTLLGLLVGFGLVKLLWWMLVGKKEEQRKRDEDLRGDAKEMGTQYVANIELDGGKAKD